MKIERIEKERTIKYIDRLEVTATDGTVFRRDLGEDVTTEKLKTIEAYLVDECRLYEQTCRCVTNTRYRKFSREYEFDDDVIGSFINDDALYCDISKPVTDEDVKDLETFLEYIKQSEGDDFVRYKGFADDCKPVFEKGKTYWVITYDAPGSTVVYDKEGFIKHLTETM